MKTYNPVPRLHGGYTFNGTTFIYQCPHGVMDAELIKHFREHREEIIKQFKELNPEFKEDEKYRRLHG